MVQGKGHTLEGAKQTRLAALVSIVVNLGLIGAELGVALATGSLAVLADAGHSLVDLAASVFAYWGVTMAARPPDRGHPYGHAKFENFSSLVQVALPALIAVLVGLHVGGHFALAHTPAVPAAACGAFLAIWGVGV